MAPEQAFSIVNMIALAAWILLALFPRYSWITERVAGTAVPVVFASIYIAILAFAWGRSAGGYSTLADVATLFSNPWLLLAGWVHYLAFDLLIGAWEVHEARDHHIPHLFVVPCLALTFLFGPAGWLMYRGLRARYRRA